MHEVPNHIQVADHSAPHAAGEAHHLAIAVPDRADAVQRALHTCRRACCLSLVLWQCTLPVSPDKRLLTSMP